jgi:hypothetical protein
MHQVKSVGPSVFPLKPRRREDNSVGIFLFLIFDLPQKGGDLERRTFRQLKLQRRDLPTFLKVQDVAGIGPVRLQASLRCALLLWPHRYIIQR